ncbi:protein FAR1-RELATED SEQUENCE 11-like [Vicia villosa]|uniref:protein FAR1-RELATED SEQUENCE 11-like n=1 Tax=Vicia villosa TaxID=3911 RepID=UPI00273A8032|nr:protein FAR1-RELATED SEQUENCE 11-like [Vicia villosa]
MENHNDYDSNNDEYVTESDYAQDDNNSVSSAFQSSDDGDGDDISHNEDFGELDATVGDKKVNIKAFIADEIRAIEFGTVEEAYEFYFKYGKCKGFAIRKSDVRTRGTEGGKITVMRQLVCNKHGLREMKHFRRADRKREHRPTTRMKCPARLRVHYKVDKNRYVVNFFEEAHNYELTPTRFIHLHPIYREISEADRAQINGL